MKWTALFIFLFSNVVFSQALTEKIHEFAKPGDLLLVELNCYSCQFIAGETQSPFAHSGILLWDGNGQWMVGESISKVNTVSLDTFLSRVPEKGKIALVRHKEFLDSDPVALNKQLKQRFLQFYGAPFDYQYLWDNFDQNGREKLYCSEMLAKLLNLQLKEPLKPTPMDFTQHWDFWNRYFQGNVPQGKLGNSPSDFFFDPSFLVIFQNF